MCVTERYRAPVFRMFWKNTKTEKSVNLPNISPNITSKKEMLPIKVYIFEFADLSASQRCKNEIHTLLVSKADFFHLRFFHFCFICWRKKLMPNIVLLNIFPKVPNLLRFENSSESYRQKKKECTLIPNRL